MRDRTDRGAPPASPSTRRALIRSTVWAAPVAVASVAMPAVAASPTCSPEPDPTAALAYDGSLSAWTQVATPGSFRTSTPVQFSARYAPGGANELGDVAVLSLDPVTSGAVTVQLTRESVCLAAGTYELSFRWTAFGRNNRGIWLTAAVLDAETGANIGGLAAKDQVTVPARSAHVSGTRSFRITLPRTAAIAVRYVIGFPAGSVGATNDIGVQAPAVTAL
ncbi:hypothetical protein [Brachybacterium hainanense]|uniref:Ig-like domain-containing protein n=1 Tax=Brachybacterium hainanense TaxID=1541174 RepID=A0ABV6RCN7_9MICO